MTINKEVNFNESNLKKQNIKVHSRPLELSNKQRKI